MAEKQVMEISPGIVLHKQQLREGNTLIYHFEIEVKKMNVVEFVADFSGSEQIEIEGRSNLISVTTIDPFSSSTIARLILRRDWKLKSKFKYVPANVGLLSRLQPKLSKTASWRPILKSSKSGSQTPTLPSRRYPAQL